jgi:RNA recognition motif-containing protein
VKLVAYAVLVLWKWVQKAEETAAIEALDGAEWVGRALKVNKAKPKEDRGSSSGNGRRNNFSSRY